jgi:adenylate cyclase
MLNLYIRAQAELVEAAGGSIDKFMGDAVLAIFEGAAKEARALSCAVEIQRAVAAMNAAGTFQVPIQVGVGISVGEVVMGNMGSEKRMEHTVIGATVNLAARLCSAAQKDEIVAQRAVLDIAGDVAGIVGRTEEEVRVKGFAEPVRCVRMRVQG